MTGRLSRVQLERLIIGLSERDKAILLDLARVRLLTGAQLIRLHFNALSDATRDRMRRRVLARLVAHGLVTTLERPIGGVRAGSSGLIYALDSGGQRALPYLLADAGREPATRARKPWTPGQAFLLHTLDVSELYVRLIEAARTNRLELVEYVTEPASWFGNGMGGVLKPDSYTLIRSSDVEDSWAIEVDRATESIPTLRRKLLAYVDFAAAGHEGPDGVTPRVLVTVPHAARLAAVQALVQDLPDPAERLFLPTLFSEAILTLEAQAQV